MNKLTRKRIFFNLESTNKTQIQKKRYQFKLAWGSAPHPAKAWKGGEDAHYVSSNILIVADGVSGWSQMGIDSGIYARKLISLAKQLVESEQALFYIERPHELAFKIVQKNEEKGSATLSILTLHPQDGVMRSYHVGDSIYGIFRQNGQAILAQQQQRSFNVPYQVFGGHINILKKQNYLMEARQVMSDVYEGKYNQFNFYEIQKCSIVLASDGLWDNLHLQQIKNQIFSEGNTDLVDKTRNLIRKVKYFSDLSQFQSPFYCKATKQGHLAQKIGKVDDTTIILAEIIIIQD